MMLRCGWKLRVWNDRSVVRNNNKAGVAGNQHPETAYTSDQHLNHRPRNRSRLPCTSTSSNKSIIQHAPDSDLKIKHQHQHQHQQTADMAVGVFGQGALASGPLVAPLVSTSGSMASVLPPSCFSSALPPPGRAGIIGIGRSPQRHPLDFRDEPSPPRGRPWCAYPPFSPSSRLFCLRRSSRR